MKILPVSRSGTRPLHASLGVVCLGLALGLGACSAPRPGAGEPPPGAGVGSASLAPALCGTVQDMVVVAHTDDDLLFMNPDMAGSVRDGHCVFTVYLTTGDNPGALADYNAAYGTAITPAQYAREREQGIQAAYAQMAGATNLWQTGSLITGSGRSVVTKTLVGNARIVLAFLRLPESADEVANSAVVTLADLYYDPGAVTTSSDGVNYSREDLISTLSDLMAQAQPKYLHFQDSDPDPFITDPNGDPLGDHVDHVIGARFVERAEERYLPAHTPVRYRDYNINAETQPNLSAADVASKSRTFGVYAQSDRLICPPTTNCTDVATFPQWLAPAYQGWLKRQYFNIDDDQPGTVLRDSRGTLEVFMTGERTSTIRTVRQTAAGSTSYGAWSDLGGNFSARPVVRAYADGRLSALVHSNGGGMYYTQQSAVGGSWAAWRNLGGAGVSDATTTLDLKNRALQLFLVSNGGEILTSTDKTGNGGWSPLTSLNGRFPNFQVWSNPAAALLPSGRTTLFVRDNKGNIRYTTQASGGNTWRSWTVLGQGFLSDPIAVPNTAGRIDLFMRGNDNALYTRQQTDQDTWTGWVKLDFGPMQFSGSPQVATASGGRTEVVVRDLDGSVVRFTRPSPTGAWNTPERLPTAIRSQAILGANFDGAGRFSVVVRGTDGQVYATSTTAPTGGWAAWSSLGN